MSAPDYNALIDAETWAYIAKLDASYPPDEVDKPIAEQRASYDAMCKVFQLPRPAGVVSHDLLFGGVPCRKYSFGGSDVVVVYYHGGGNVVGGLDSHDDICAEICARSGFDVIAVDYRLAPEAPFPACFNDAWDAFKAIAVARKGDILLCGDSAGGNLSAAVSHHARGRVDGRIKGQVLIYPSLGGDTTKGSFVTHTHAPQLTMDDVAFYRAVRAGGGPIPQGDPRFFPLHDGDFSGLPPSVIIAVECDPLSSDGESYRNVVLAAGGKAVSFNEPGLVHACLRARHMSARAAAMFDKVIDGIKALGKGEWPYSSGR